MSRKGGLVATAPWKNWVLVPLVLVCVALLVGAHYRFLTSGGRYANDDFMTLWCAGKAVLQGVDPYDPVAWPALRARYGSVWMPNLRMPYPIWTAWVMVPLALLDLNWAAACWLVLLELLVGACCLVLMTQLGARKPSALEFGLLMLGAFLLRGTMSNLDNGQLSLVLLAILTAFLVLYKRGRRFWAGIVLCGIAFKPSSFLLFAPLVVLALAQRQKWRTLAGTAVGGTVLLSAGWLLEPGWLARWLSVRGKTEVTFQTPTVWGLAYDLAPAWWPALGLAFVVLVVALCGAWAFRQRELDLVEIVPLAVGGSLLVTPYAWAYEHALLLIPLTLLFAWMDDRKWAWLVWISGTLIVPWSLFWVALQRERDSMSWLVPLSVTVVLYVFVLRQRRRQGQEKAVG